MYTSTEIRWFFKHEPPRVIDWFARKGITFGTIRKRTDHYLRYGQEDLGIKLREGKVEIKYRTAIPEERKIGSHTTGYMESWNKWSFAIDGDDPWAEKIIHFEAGKEDWTPVEKWRLGVKRTYDNQGNLIFRGISENVTSACQIELTRIQVYDHFYFTFGIEWYGEKYVPLSPGDLDGILGNAVFPVGQSMGYAAFLLTLRAS